MAVTTGATFHYQPPDGLGVPHVRPLGKDGRAAELLHDELMKLGLDPHTVVTDIGDETVGQHQVKLIGWLDRDGLPQVTSVCLRLFCDNFRRVGSG
jgi:hypothetical protein